MSWQVASSLVLGAVLLGGFAWYERSRPPAKVLSLVAALAALAVVGRLAFAAFPNVKPTTDIVLFAGYALGPAPGFAVGAVAALVSNVFLSQGPWTAWQMVGWGGIGVGGALLARAARGRQLGRLSLALACGLSGLAFGALMDLYQWTLAGRQDPASYLAISSSSLPYNLAHAIGNVAFCLVAGPSFLRALRHYRLRFEVRWEAPAPKPGALAAVAAALSLAVALCSPPPAAASSASARAVRYLERAQNRDGGLGAARGQGSSQLFTGWAGLGLASAGRNPRDVHRRRGRAITTYMRRRARSLTDTGELERTILVLKAAGLPPRRFAGRDLVAELLARRRADGSWSGTVNLTAFGVLALRAAGAGPLEASTRYLERVRNADGGFGFAPRATSDVDDTGAALEALAAAGQGRAAAGDRAVSYLRAAQGDDGGFGQMEGRDSNAQSTAWAVQGLVAVAGAPPTVARALDYLRRLQRPDGSIRYSRSSSQTPVWVTAQALTALRRKAFPPATVPRRARPRRARARSSGPPAAAKASSSRARRRSAARRATDPRRRAERAARRALSLAGLRAAGPPAGGRRRAAAGEGVPVPMVGGGGVVAIALLGLLGTRIRRRRLPTG